MSLIHEIRFTIQAALTGKCDEEVIKDLLTKFNENSLVFVDNKNNYEFKNINEFLYIEHNRTQDKFIFYTLDNNYQLIDRVTDIATIINDNFAQLDKINLVNLKKIKKYHSYLCKVYFEDDTEKGLSLAITQTTMKHVVIKALGTCLDLNENGIGLYPHSKTKGFQY